MFLQVAPTGSLHRKLLFRAFTGKDVISENVLPIPNRHDAVEEERERGGHFFF